MTAKKKDNAFMDIMADEGQDTVAPVESAVPRAPAGTPADTKTGATAKKGEASANRQRGRPRKADAEDIQSTTVRLNSDDHTALRMLALRDKKSMNDVIITALAEYCEKRSVRFGK
ncbi:hypothetical protein ACNSPR_31135 [Klebsiella pneumoniae]